MATSALTGKPQLNRLINRRLILDRIRRCDKVSRADLAKQTEIRPPTVSAVVRELIEEGLVQEVGPGKTSGGRVPQMVSLTRQKPCTLGFEMRLNRVTAGLCDLSGGLCDQLEEAVEPMTPAVAVETLRELGSKLLGKAGLEWQSLRGVGVAMPGHLDAKRGHVRWSRAFEWRDVPLKSLCEAAWGVATDVVNDSQAGALAAQQFELQAPVDNLVYVYLAFQNQEYAEIGVGTGIIIHGELYHGEFGAAGEITTPIVHPIASYRSLTKKSCNDLDEFIAAVESRDANALQAIQLAGEQLGPLLLHIVNILEPGAIVVGSDAQPLCDMLLQRFEAMLQKNNLAYQAGRTKVVSSMLGSYGVTRGAVVPTLQRVFRMPQWS